MLRCANCLAMQTVCTCSASCTRLDSRYSAMRGTSPLCTLKNKNAIHSLRPARASSTVLPLLFMHPKPEENS